MLAGNADEELAADRNGRRSRGQKRIVSAQKQRQRQRGNEGAQRVETRQAQQRRRGELHAERGPENGCCVLPAGAKAQIPGAESQQRGEHGNLVVARVHGTGEWSQVQDHARCKRRASSIGSKREPDCR